MGRYTNKISIAILFGFLIYTIALPTIHAQEYIVKSIDQLTPEEFQQLLKWDPELEGYKILPVADPTRLERYVEPPKVQEVILTPLRVEEGPQFVRPQEIFAIKVVLKNKDDIAYQIAILRRPPESLFDKLKGAWDWLVTNIQRLFGIAPEEPEVINETWEVIPVYYLIAALDPEKVEGTFQGKTVIVYPGGLLETKPGYGCYDIVLGNEYQFSQVIPKLERGEISLDDIMCGKIEYKDIFGLKIPQANSKFGPITIALPVEVYKEGGELGKAVVQVKDNEIVAVLQGCTDKGDGQDYIYEAEIAGKRYRVHIPSKPHDCILTPGESMEFVIYGMVNPLPSGMIPPEVIGNVITTLYTKPEEASKLMYKYPGAIHEVYLMVGRINDVNIGITDDDIKQTLGSFIAPATGAALGFITKGPIGVIIGAGVGFLVNWLALGSPMKLPAIEKAFVCVYSGRCIYEVATLKTVKTFLVIAAPQFQVTLYLVHLGLVVAAIILGGYLGYRAARY